MAQLDLDEKVPSTLKTLCRFDPKTDSWLQDHCPTYVIPALPFTVMVSIMMDAANALRPHLKVIGLEKAQVTNWVSFENGAKEIQIEARILNSRANRIIVKVSLSQYREARLKELSRFEPFCSGLIILDESYPHSDIKPSFPEIQAARHLSGKEFYGAERIFSGPSLQLIDEIFSTEPGKAISFLKTIPQIDPRSEMRMAFLIDASFQTPVNTQFLMDASIRTIFKTQFEELDKKNLQVPAGVAHAILKATFYSDYPNAERVRCEVGFAGFFQGNERFPSFDIRIFDGESPQAMLWAEFHFVGILFSMGKLLERIPEGYRKAFLQDRKPLSESGISNFIGPHETSVTVQDIKDSDWLPGTVASVYLGSKAEWIQYRSLEPQAARDWLAIQVAAKDLLSRELRVHPSRVQIESDSTNHLTGRSDHYPFNCCKLNWIREGKSIRVISDGKVQLDEARIGPLQEYWRSHLGNQIDSPPELLWMAIFSRFWHKLQEIESTQLNAFKGRPCIYLANHQTYVESLIVVIVLSVLGGCPVLALTKEEHRNLWLGYFIDLFYKYPNNRLPKYIEFVKRDSPHEILNKMERLEGILTHEGKSVLIHVEGKRARTARQKVEKLSSIWGDLAIKTGRPIVPMRILGGLPLEDTGKKFDFPIGYVAQNYHLGPPIDPQEFRKLPYAERSRFLREAINSLGESEDEVPSTSDERFVARVRVYKELTGADEARSVLFQCLATSRYAPLFSFQSGVHQFKDLTQAFIVAGELAVELRQSTALVLPETPEGEWVRELARWLYGPHGPVVCTPQTIPSGTVIQVFGGF